jgi:hypothetical protein
MVFFNIASRRDCELHGVKDRVSDQSYVQEFHLRALMSKNCKILQLKKSFFDIKNQCYGSGSGIRCLFDPWIRDPE